jgi:hypothetical protein
MTSKLLIILLISLTTCSSLRDLATVGVTVGIKSTSLALASGSTIELSVTCTTCGDTNGQMTAKYTLTGFTLASDGKTAIALTCPESAAITATTAVDVSCTTGAAAEAATYTLTVGTVASEGSADTITPTLDDNKKTVEASNTNNNNANNNENNGGTNNNSSVNLKTWNALFLIIAILLA